LLRSNFEKCEKHKLGKVVFFIFTDQPLFKRFLFRRDGGLYMGLKSHQWMCWSKACCSQLKSLLNLLLTAQKSMLNFFYSQLRSLLLELLPTDIAQVCAGVLLLTAQLTKSRFYLPCDVVFYKKSGFLERWVLSTCYPVERKITSNFSLRGPQHMLSGRKQKRNSKSLLTLSNRCYKFELWQLKNPPLFFSFFILFLFFFIFARQTHLTWGWLTSS